MCSPHGCPPATDGRCSRWPRGWFWGPSQPPSSGDEPPMSWAAPGPQPCAMASRAGWPEAGARISVARSRPLLTIANHTGGSLVRRSRSRTRSSSTRSPSRGSGARSLDPATSAMTCQKTGRGSDRAEAADRGYGNRGGPPHRAGWTRPEIPSDPPARRSAAPLRVPAATETPGSPAVPMVHVCNAEHGGAAPRAESRG